MDQGTRAHEENSLAVQPASHLVHGVLHFLRIARIRKNILFGALLVFTALGGLYFASATRYYEAKASLLIRQNGSEVSPPSLAGDGGHRDIMPTYKSLVKKSKVLERAIEGIGPESRVDFRGVPRDKWIDVLKENLSASVERRTNMLVVGYQSKDPDAAKTIVTAVIEAYVSYINETHRGEAISFKSILQEKRTEVLKSLALIEQKLAQAQNAFHSPIANQDASYTHPLQQAMLEANESYLAAQEQRIKLDAAMVSIRHAVRNGLDLQPHLMKYQEFVGRELLLAGLGLNSRDAHVGSEIERARVRDMAELQTLLVHFGARHPRVAEVEQRLRAADQYLVDQRLKVQQQVEIIKSSQLGPMLVDSITQERQGAMDLELRLKSKYEAACEQARALNVEAFEIEKLRREYESLQQERAAMVAQIASIDLSQQQGGISAEITEEPVANRVPVSPRLPIVGVASLFMALLFGGAAIYVLDILDDRFRSPEELQMHLGVPVLAMVRQMEIDASAVGMASVQTHYAPDAPASEAFRTLRTALAFSSEESGRLVISSSEPGDGKTTVLVNLAVSYAQSGKKTLLIDGDLRRPGMTALLRLKGQRGVTDVLRASSSKLVETATHTVLSTEVEGLDVLPSGPRQPNPGELLTGQNLADLLAWAETVYDQVLVDSPPVLAATDSQVLSRLVDGVILVVNSEKNRRRAVMRAVESFQGVGSPVIGVVANRITNESGGYGYGYGYGYTYDYGAAPDEEEEEVILGEEVAQPAEDNHLPGRAA